MTDVPKALQKHWYTFKEKIKRKDTLNQMSLLGDFDLVPFGTNEANTFKE